MQTTLPTPSAAPKKGMSSAVLILGAMVLGIIVGYLSHPGRLHRL